MELMKWEGPAGADVWDAFGSMKGEHDKAFDLFGLPESAGIFDQAWTSWAAPPRRRRPRPTSSTRAGGGDSPSASPSMGASTATMWRPPSPMASSP